MQEDIADVEQAPAIAGIMRKRNKPGGRAVLRQSGLAWPRVRSLLAERSQETAVEWELA